MPWIFQDRFVDIREHIIIKNTSLLAPKNPKQEPKPRFKQEECKMLTDGDVMTNADGFAILWNLDGNEDDKSDGVWLYTEMTKYHGETRAAEAAMDIMKTQARDVANRDESTTKGDEGSEQDSSEKALL
jgi:hypothetical protein